MTIFTPLADEKIAPATILIEVATVKPNGYLQSRVIVPAAMVGQAAEAVGDYYSKQNRPAPVIVTRTVGTVDWEFYGDTTTTIPDALPEGFGE